MLDGLLPTPLIHALALWGLTVLVLSIEHHVHYELLRQWRISRVNEHLLEHRAHAALTDGAVVSLIDAPDVPAAPDATASGAAALPARLAV
jgi:hypothetical protein